MTTIRLTSIAIWGAKICRKWQTDTMFSYGENFVFRMSVLYVKIRTTKIEYSIMNLDLIIHGE